MINPTEAFQDVRDELESLGLAVYHAQVPEYEDLPRSNGVMLPFLVVYNGGPVHGSGSHHIVGTRNDTTVLFWTVSVYAARASEAELYKGKVVNLLAGFRPTDTGELVLTGGMAYSRASNTVRPTLYIEEVSFNARSNLSWND